MHAGCEAENTDTALRLTLPLGSLSFITLSCSHSTPSAFISFRTTLHQYYLLPMGTFRKPSLRGVTLKICTGSYAAGKGIGPVLFNLIFNLLINQVANLQLTFMLLVSNYVLPVQLFRVELNGSHEWNKNYKFYLNFRVSVFEF